MERAVGNPVAWRCRRGVKELDLLLERFARERYASAPLEVRRAFERLLELPDPAIIDLLLSVGAECGPGGAGEMPRPAEASPASDPELAAIAALVAIPGRR